LSYGQVSYKFTPNPPVDEMPGAAKTKELNVDITRTTIRARIAGFLILTNMKFPSLY